ncbi:Uma2 family endonuclease [Thermosynechococcus sp. JY1334]|uniref:Uma2 family endonuclease n=1 Tax=unclassified Thermosynechococcus TaxID=2622553 RepID=UPI00197D048C|nr:MULTISPECIES: Uma2 family endonuclease [unclassified Thermosynechococcus]MDR7897723.1 Uma2 family endonuclease [Thermosynechococcus sp. JY1332]MDR7905121.1 Uma2 family endonuclease [Thermosynechococcus sp. JY1334]MDR7992947.1 Uma2 family endonuclease [Thermosynechococcus sp. TG252]QSF48779.1 Uma2 family endonuclease [Thermosynechococcus sp. TA-1]WKT87340.1 Uma2 family endonuclease [Thermosynechococcus sp. JY1339]
MTTVLEPAVTYLTPEAYLAQEVVATERHEYRQGELYTMPGGSVNHNELVRSLTVLLSLALKGQPYRVFVTDQRLWIPETQSYYYPDVMVTPKPVPLVAGRNDVVMQPIFIAEVLSPSTADRDRGTKFFDYRQIPTLQEYLLISQDRPCVEQYLRQAEYQWLLTIWQDITQELLLPSLQTSLKLSGLYADVELGES